MLSLIANFLFDDEVFGISKSMVKAVATGVDAGDGTVPIGILSAETDKLEDI